MADGSSVGLGLARTALDACGELCGVASLILPAFLSLRYSISGVVFGLSVTGSSAALALFDGADSVSCSRKAMNSGSASMVP